MKKLHSLPCSRVTVEYDRDSIDDEVIHRMLEVIHGDGQLVKGWSIVTEIHLRRGAIRGAARSGARDLRLGLFARDQQRTRVAQCNNVGDATPSPSGKATHNPLAGRDHGSRQRQRRVTRPERLMELPMIEVAIAWAFAQRRH